MTTSRDPVIFETRHTVRFREVDSEAQVVSKCRMRIGRTDKKGRFNTIVS